MRPKSEDARQAILAAATELFARDGYANTTMSRIAKSGGMSTSNLYVYYKSKLAIILEIYERWITEQIVALERRVAAEKGAEAKIRCLVNGICDDIPSDREGYTRALVQALSLDVPPEDYDDRLLVWIEGRIEAMLAQIADFSGVDLAAVSYLMMMIFDSVGLRRDLPPRPRIHAAMKDTLTALLLRCAARSTTDRPAAVSVASRRLVRQKL